MGIEFNVAAKAKQARDLRAAGDDEAAEELEYVEVPIDGEVYRAFRPDPVKLTVLLSADGRDAPRMILAYLEDLMGTKAKRHIQQLLWNGQLTFDDLFFGTEQNPKGLIFAISEEFAGRPTEPSTDSAESQPSGGRRSTASKRAAGKNSTSSTSGSTGS